MYLHKSTLSIEKDNICIIMIEYLHERTIYQQISTIPVHIIQRVYGTQQ
jgi:hypothetical protein